MNLSNVSKIYENALPNDRGDLAIIQDEEEKNLTRMDHATDNQAYMDNRELNDHARPAC